MPTSKSNSLLNSIIKELIPDELENVLGVLESLFQDGRSRSLLEQPFLINALLDRVEKQYGKNVLTAMQAALCKGKSTRAGQLLAEDEEIPAEEKAPEYSQEVSMDELPASELATRFELPEDVANMVSSLAGKARASGSGKGLCGVLASRLGKKTTAKPKKKSSPKSTAKKPAAKKSTSEKKEKPSSAKSKPKTASKDKDDAAEKKAKTKKPPKKTSSAEKPADRPKTTKKTPAKKPSESTQATKRKSTRKTRTDSELLGGSEAEASTPQNGASE
jgi:hypothetical protein